MSNQPLVSILINNYNYGKFLAEAIDSALAQTYDRCETIVVDDGSTDNSQEIIASYGDRVVPVLKVNGGQASAFNAGFAASSGEIICFLDADDLFFPEKAAAIVQAFERYPDSGWFYHSLEYRNETDIQQDVAPKSQPISKEAEVWDLRSPLLKNHWRVKFPKIIPATSGICFSRSVLEKMLPMPEGKGIALNENYLKFLALAFAPGVTIEQPLAIQRIHQSNAFTCRQNQERMAPRINLINAYWMRTNFPYLSGYANKLFASGLGQSWQYTDKATEGSDNPISIESCQVVEKYLSMLTLPEQLIVRLKAAFYYFKP
jgi:glycosyltransferase involved in cell wall biosynthesis